jgi:hypothetical protein
MVGRKDEDLMDSSCGPFSEDGSPIFHHEGLVTFKSGIFIWNDTNFPSSVFVVGHQCRGRLFFVAWAERAGL